MHVFHHTLKCFSNRCAYKETEKHFCQNACETFENMLESDDGSLIDGTEPKWSHVALQELIAPRFRADKIPIRRFFLARYTQFPCLMTCISTGTDKASLHVTTVLKHLADKFGHQPENDVVVHDYNDKIKEYFVK